MKKIITTMLCITLAVVLCGCDKSSDSETVDRFSSLDGSEAAVITDSKTGVQYLFVKLGYGAGLTVLVDEDGKPLLDGDEA